MLKEFIEKQYFIVNMDVKDIADSMIEDEGKTEDRIAYEDILYIDQLLQENSLSINKLEGSSAIIQYNHEERALYITLNINEQMCKVTLLDFLEDNKYKKITSYFLGKTHVLLKNVSYQIGGSIDKNYGFKFMVEI